MTTMQAGYPLTFYSNDNTPTYSTHLILVVNIQIPRPFLSTNWSLVRPPTLTTSPCYDCPRGHRRHHTVALFCLCPSRSSSNIQTHESSLSLSPFLFLQCYYGRGRFIVVCVAFGCQPVFSLSPFCLPLSPALLPLDGPLFSAACLHSFPGDCVSCRGLWASECGSLPLPSGRDGVVVVLVNTARADRCTRRQA